jgi:hypothetical protein
MFEIYGSDYCAKTLTPVIVIESVLLVICDDALLTNLLKFCLTENGGCADAIFALKSTAEYFIDGSSNVYMAPLDISEAFDRVHHYKLLSFVTVRWCSCKCC